MTGSVAGATTSKVMQLITSDAGVTATLLSANMPGPLPVELISTQQVSAQNVPVEISDRSQGLQYPMLQVYCEKVSNLLEEKFRTFSGKAQMAVEIRHSQDRIDGLERALGYYADAMMQVLDFSRGDFGEGMYYAGGYQVVFSAVKHGGKNFVQSAKVSFEIGVSIN
jgi:hypothetical protein